MQALTETIIDEARHPHAIDDHNTVDLVVDDLWLPLRLAHGPRVLDD
jgi:hypothetical protein